MQRAWTLLLTGFTLFILTIIVLKNTGTAEWFFEMFTWIPRHDKVGHVVLMGILSFLSVRAVSPRLSCRPGMATSIIMGLLLAVIAVEEWSQQLVANRSFSEIDYLCSAAGVLIFGTAAHLLRRPFAGVKSNTGGSRD